MASSRKSNDEEKAAKLLQKLREAFADPGNEPVAKVELKADVASKEKLSSKEISLSQEILETDLGRVREALSNLNQNLFLIMQDLKSFDEKISVRTDYQSLLKGLAALKLELEKQLSVTTEIKGVIHGYQEKVTQDVRLDLSKLAALEKALLNRKVVVKFPNYNEQVANECNLSVEQRAAWEKWFNRDRYTTGLHLIEYLRQTVHQPKISYFENLNTEITQLDKQGRDLLLTLNSLVGNAQRSNQLAERQAQQKLVDSIRSLKNKLSIYIAKHDRLLMKTFRLSFDEKMLLAVAKDVKHTLKTKDSSGDRPGPEMVDLKLTLARAKVKLFASKKNVHSSGDFLSLEKKQDKPEPGHSEKNLNKK